MHHFTSKNVNFQLATSIKSKKLNICCINLRLQQLQAIVINIINRHCYKRSGEILNRLPKTARSTQTSCKKLSREGMENGNEGRMRQEGMGWREKLIKLLAIYYI